MTITATVTPRPDSTYPIILTPYKLDLSQFSDKLIDKADFTITNVGDKKLDISMVSYPEDLFEVKLPKSVKPGKTATAHLKLKKDAYEHSFEKSFTIQLNDELNTRFTIPVKRTYRHVPKPEKTRTLPRGK